MRWLIDEAALLGKGDEARVFALDAQRVLRLPHFGSMAIGGPRDLDPLVAIAHLEPEITPRSSRSPAAVSPPRGSRAG